VALGESTDAAPLPTSESGRRELAEWIRDRRNPLTARVMVNRIWQKLMGEGLVRTVDNLGMLGTRPTHPELLDRLAIEFMENGWSVKHLVRQVVLSHGYRVDSAFVPELAERDPENRLWGRASHRRLTAESIRDSLLAAGDQLDLAQGEAPVDHLGTLVSQNRPDAAVTLPEESFQRTIYQPVIRGELSPLLTAFDFADPDLVVGQRPVTTTPAQALLLLNSPFVQRQANQIADKLERVHASPGVGAPEAPDGVETRVTWLYRRLYGRFPSEDELHDAAGYLRECIRKRDLDVGQDEHGTTAGPTSATTEAPLPTRDRWYELIQAMLAATEFRMLD
jgi:hypothetical protein